MELRKMQPATPPWLWKKESLEQRTAFMTYQNAKMKYREAMNGRGTDPDELRRRSQKHLKLAKQRSYTAAHASAVVTGTFHSMIPEAWW